MFTLRWAANSDERPKNFISFGKSASTDINCCTGITNAVFEDVTTKMELKIIGQKWVHFGNYISYTKLLV